MIDRDNMSGLSRRLLDSVQFTRSFKSANSSFETWQSKTRAFVTEALGLDNTRAASARTIERRDHGSHESRLLELAFSSGETTEAFLLLPAGKTRRRAVLLLHDHGSRFDIGKEKLIGHGMMTRRVPQASGPNAVTAIVILARSWSNAATLSFALTPSAGAAAKETAIRRNRRWPPI